MDDKILKITQSEEQKENKNEKGLQKLWDTKI